MKPRFLQQAKLVSQVPECAGWRTSCLWSATTAGSLLCDKGLALFLTIHVWMSRLFVLSWTFQCLIPDSSLFSFYRLYF